MIQCSNASYFDPSNKFVWPNNSFLTAVFVELTVWWTIIFTYIHNFLFTKNCSIKSYVKVFFATIFVTE